VKQMTISNFRIQTAEEIREGGCVDVVSNGEHVFYAIVGAKEEMANQIVSRASQIDASRGKE